MEKCKQEIYVREEPWHREWNQDELESVSYCPVCGDHKRMPLLQGLVDNVFRVAPGHWNLYQCETCASAYLDPRPDKKSIGLAYRSYYTHKTVEPKKDSGLLGGVRLLRRKLANGYVNDRYGTNYQPSSRFGVWIARLLSGQRDLLDAQFRWLYKPRDGQRLLDIGCGNGEFLLKARDAGWQVMGVDPDIKAVETALQSGLDVVNGGVEKLDDINAAFDAVTLSHVIEHVHKPEVLLRAANRLLKPGGILYIETPNIQSQGAKYFGPDWRGIESPRHLVLFSHTGLDRLLEKCGFTEIEHQQRAAITRIIFLSSYRLQKGVSPDNITPRFMTPDLYLRAMFSSFFSSQSEFITLQARKISV